VLDLFLRLALDDGARHGLGLDLQLEDALAADRFDQGAVLLAARLDPADRLLLGGAAFDKARRRQGFFHVFDRGGPVGPDAVDDEVLEQGLPWGWGKWRKQGWPGSHRAGAHLSGSAGPVSGCSGRRRCLKTENMKKNCHFPSSNGLILL
jgi:hypothetical protein